MLPKNNTQFIYLVLPRPRYPRMVCWWVVVTFAWLCRFNSRNIFVVCVVLPVRRKDSMMPQGTDGGGVTTLVFIKLL
jgi:hypothetical protein